MSARQRNVRDFGAVGDGRTKDTAAIQAAIDAGGLVYFPLGVYLTGTLYLRSNGGLDLAPGAVILGSPDPEDYNADDFCPQNQVFKPEHVSGAHLITAVEQKNIILRGFGRIDGNRESIFNEVDPNWLPYFKHVDWRPGQMIFLCECEDVRIQDLELYNSPYWTCFLYGCEKVSISGVRIYEDNRVHHGDGIDIDCCRFVTISDCIIESADDCITLRGNDASLKNKKATEYIVITNCIFRKTHTAGFRIGVGSGTVRNVTISNIVMEDVRTGISIVSQFSMAHIGVQIEDILFQNIQMKTLRPLTIQSYFNGPQQFPAKHWIRRIGFSHIRASGCMSSFIQGNLGGGVSDVNFSDVIFDYYGGEHVREGENLIYGENGVPCAPAAFRLTYADKISFNHVKVNWNTDNPNWKYGIWGEDVSGIEIANCSFGKPNMIHELE